MTTAEILFWSRELGVLLGALIAAFAVSDRITKIAIFLMERWRKQRLDARLRSVLIVPNIEEIAKYSIQEPQRHEPSKVNYTELIEQKKSEKIREKKLLVSQVRVSSIMLTFALTFITLGIRYIKISLE